MSDELILSSTDKKPDGSPLQLCPRPGLTRNKRFDGEYVPVAVLSVRRLHDQADWTAQVSLAGEESVMAIPREMSREQAAEHAWRSVCLAAARIGKEA